MWRRVSFSVRHRSRPRFPRWGYYRVRAVKEGFAPVEHAYFAAGQRHDRADAACRTRGAARHGVGAGRARRRRRPRQRIFLVTGWTRTKSPTEQFKAFVDAGGYSKKEYWKHPFIKDGRELSWQEAMEEFRDATRRPGPAGWQLGTYPEGADDLPVGGVSWYEAAAYAEFTGKSLPTVYEWFAAAGGCRRHLRHSAVEQLRRPGTCSRGNPSGNGPLRKLRHGRQPEGMGRQPPRRPALRARRRLERAGIHVQPLRCQAAPFARRSRLDSAWSGA